MISGNKLQSASAVCTWHFDATD